MRLPEPGPVALLAAAAAVMAGCGSTGDNAAGVAERFYAEVAESDEQQRIGRHAAEDSPRWARVGGLRTRLYSNSLLLVMGAIWVASWLGQSITGRVAYNAERLDHTQGALSYGEYLTSADFWERTLQNWQSEFLAVGSMAILAVYLRQRGSPESKPVGAPHRATSVEG